MSIPKPPTWALDTDTAPVALPSPPVTGAQTSWWQRLNDWEHWPFAVFYFPLFFVWAWYALRARAFWWLGPSNPTLTWGGFEGEGKKEMYAQLPLDSFPTTVFILPQEDFSVVLQKIAAAGLRWPFIVKPDVGMKALFFRKIDDEEQLREYHQRCPVEYLAQNLVELPVEVGVFYVRHPTETKGRITGMVQKDPPRVSGDGQSTLRELIAAHPRARFRFDEMVQRHAAFLDLVLLPGQTYYLSYAGSRNRGAQIINLNHLIDDRLAEVFDRFSLYNGQFFYGRYDVKCASVEEMKAGRNFTIIEFNGCGSGITHIFHHGLTVFQAYAEILRHWKMLASISRYNHRHQGVPYWPLFKGLRRLREANRMFRWLETHDY